jgi:hypothetical protein
MVGPLDDLVRPALLEIPLNPTVEDLAVSAEAREEHWPQVVSSQVSLEAASSLRRVKENPQVFSEAGLGESGNDLAGPGWMDRIPQQVSYSKK